TDLIEYNECEKKEYDSLSELMGYYYKNAVQDKKNEKKEKLIKRLGDQEKQLVELKEKEQTYKKIGDIIYEKYSLISEVIEKENKKKELEIEIEE
ncbi:MAG: hypothetical protein PHU63_02570, partial [Candidatus ainarchaeum sp.]|nr:hypothetical protein [Candidatus ainarchaeum sp.]